MMRICVAGLWHLGSVTAACLASGGHSVVGVDDDAKVIDGLSQAKPPLFEPGLEELIARELEENRLSFTTDFKTAASGADALVIAYDTPVDENDNADIDFVFEKVKRLIPLAPDNCLILISSQLPVGSTMKLADHAASLGRAGKLGFGYSPENLRLGKAIEVFCKPDRVVVGVSSPAYKDKANAIFAPFTDNVLHMSVQSAEMTKHAINAFLAMSISFANELATICENVGADASDVAKGLKSEKRIGPQAYVSPGVAFSGGTLARDVRYLAAIAQERALDLPLLPSIGQSNSNHFGWPVQRLRGLLGDLKGRSIALLGLTYKPGTDTLRRSYALALASLFIDAGAQVNAYDPVVRRWPEDFETHIALKNSVDEALAGADAVVVATEWPEFLQLDWPAFASIMARPLIVDPKGFLAPISAKLGGFAYATVGRMSDTLQQQHQGG